MANVILREQRSYNLSYMGMLMPQINKQIDDANTHHFSFSRHQKTGNKQLNDLAMSGHDNIGLGVDSILASPQAGDGLLLSVEVQARLAIESAGATTSDTLLVSGEGEHGEGNGDRTSSQN